MLEIKVRSYAHQGTKSLSHWRMVNIFLPASEALRVYFYFVVLVLLLLVVVLVVVVRIDVSQIKAF
jgi:hypothetical protein